MGEYNIVVINPAAVHFVGFGLIGMLWLPPYLKRKNKLSIQNILNKTKNRKATPRMLRISLYLSKIMTEEVTEQVLT